MRLRNRDKNEQKTVPVDGAIQRPSTGSCKKILKESVPLCAAKNVRKREVLKENTNVYARKGERCRGKSPGRIGGSDVPVVKEKRLRSSTGALNKENGRKSANLREPEANSSSSSLISKKCVYMNASEEQQGVASNKESVYEFEVDKNEPPSRRRRRRLPRKKGIVKKPRFPKAKIPSRCETSSLANSSVATSSFAASTDALSHASALSLRENAENVTPLVIPDPVVPDSPDLPSPNFVISPRTPATVKKQLHFMTNRPADCSPFRNQTASGILKENNSIPVPLTASVGCAPHHVDSSRISSNSCVQERRAENSLRSSFYDSTLLSTDLPGGFKRIAHLHSTPVKVRSDSDSTSSFLPADQSSHDNCFGFSSDEEECENDGMPSPLHMSPHSHAIRHGHLSPKGAPSRFSANVVKRALLLDPAGILLSSNHTKVTAMAKRGRAKGAKGKGGCRKKVAPLNAESDAKVCEVRAESFLSPPKEAVTPPGKCLFEDVRREDDVPQTVRPLRRRSYERPLQRKLKVIGGGLCLDSGDEGAHEKSEEEMNVVEPKVCPKPQRRRQKPKVELMEKQLDQWASVINSQFNEVEDFDLVLE